MGETIEFSGTRVLRHARQVWRNDQPVALGGRAFDVLLALIDQRHRVVAKDELLRQVWPGRVVEESNLAVQVVALRRALGPGVIATVHGRGYRFVAELAAATAGPPLTAPADDGTRLFGRDAELHTLLQAVQRHRLVTLTGAPGVGKSRLAQAALQQLRDSPLAVAWPDGLHQADLAGVASPGQLVPALCRAMGLHTAWTAGQDAGVPLSVATEALAQDLAGTRAVLLLDNAEHLHAAVVALAGRLLQAAPGLHLLVASRQALALPGEELLHLQGLQAGFALQFFLERARALAPRACPDAAAEQQVLALCHALDGLPLALELAAARLPLLGLPGLLEALQQPVPAPALAQAGGRHGSLQLALAWSYQLLQPAEQALLQALAVPAAGFDLAMVQALAGAAPHDAGARWQAVEVFEALCRQSLVEADAPGPRRWRLLRPVRAFALQALQASGNEAQVRERHALAMAARMDALDDAWCAGQRSELALHAEAASQVDDLCLALDWAHGSAGRPALVAALLQGGARVLRAHGRRAQAAPWLGPALAHAGQLPAPHAARLWLALAHVAAPGSPLREPVLAGLLAAVPGLGAGSDPVRAVLAASAAALLARKSSDAALAAQALALGHAHCTPLLPARVRATLLCAHTILVDFHGLQAPLDDALLHDVLHDLQAAGDAACRPGVLIRICLAERLLLRRRWAPARRLLQAVCDDIEAAGWGGAELALAPLDTLAMAHLGAGNVPAAQALLRRSMLAARWVQAWLELAGPLAWCLAAQGRHRAAALLAGAAQAHCAARDPHADRVVLLALHQACRLVQAAQGKPALQRWLAEGAKLEALGLHQLMDGRDARFLP